eukprot:5391744-Amphidinium_carterae.2
MVVIREYQDPYQVVDKWMEVGAKETPFRWVGKTIFEKPDSSSSTAAKRRDPPGTNPDDEPATQRARQVAFVGPLMHHDGTVKTGIVDVEKLPSKGHKDLFLKGSRIIEGKTMAKILTPVGESEATKIMSNSENVVIPARTAARWLDVFKQVDEQDAPTFQESLVPKSRLILQGFHDKYLLNLSRSVAAAEQHELPFVLQVLADQKWAGVVGDVPQTFTQAAKTPLEENNRGHPVYVLLPAAGVPSLEGVRLAKLEVEGYGLTTGPLSWRNSLYATCRDQGVMQHPLGPCTLLYYDGVSKKLSGILLIQVDDILGGGEGPGWQKLISTLRKTYMSLANGSHFMEV